MAYGAPLRPQRLFRVPAGLRATTLSVPSNIDYLEQGFWVDVLQVRRDRTEASTIATSLLVVDVAPAGRADDSARRHVTVLTTPGVHHALTRAGQSGTVHLALRNDLDVSRPLMMGAVNLTDLRATLRRPELRDSSHRTSRLRIRRAPDAPLSTAARQFAQEPLATFSMDVDTASWTLARSALFHRRLPKPSEVRTEEIVNALPYQYAPPTDASFAAYIDVAASPWTIGHHVVKIGLVAREVPEDDRPPLRLTLLVDASGSMRRRLPLVQRSVALLLDELAPADAVAVVAFANRARIQLPFTEASDTATILDAVSELNGRGGTGLEAGLRKAYEVAASSQAPGAIHRVVICTDGVANIGRVTGGSLASLVRAQADLGISLTTIGFGVDPYSDQTLEQLSGAADGNYGFVRSLGDAHKVLVDEFMATMVVVARDAKVQIAWDEDRVLASRLVGYDDRRLKDAQFRDDAVDAGDVGSGDRVTALFEVRLAPGDYGRSLGTLFVRSEPPGRERGQAKGQSWPIPGTWAGASPDTRVAIAAATFAERLRHNPEVLMDLGRISKLVDDAMRHDHQLEDADLVNMMIEAWHLGLDLRLEGSDREPPGLPGAIAAFGVSSGAYPGQGLLHTDGIF